MIDIQNIIKQHIATKIRFNCYNNIQLRTKDIKELSSEINNRMIYDELNALENANIIKIQQVAKANILFDNRENWIMYKQKFCRYSIDILQPEYFELKPVAESSWTIKAYVDTVNWNFVVELNGIEEKFYVPLKQKKNSLIRKFWEYAQNNINTEFYCDKEANYFGNCAESLSSFFRRFCVDLKKYFLHISKGKVRFTPIIYSDVLKTNNVKKLVFYPNTERRQTYECEFDDNDKFLGWRKL